jgi:hypothetical protein
MRASYINWRVFSIFLIAVAVTVTGRPAGTLRIVPGPACGRVFLDTPKSFLYSFFVKKRAVINRNYWPEVHHVICLQHEAPLSAESDAGGLNGSCVINRLNTRSQILCRAHFSLSLHRAVTMFILPGQPEYD